MNYEDFIASKSTTSEYFGFAADGISDYLFDFQRAIVAWACERGRAAIFADTGLGKTLMQVEWARQVAQHSGGKVIILAPLCVAQQTVAEAVKINVPIQYCRAAAEINSQIVITNYEMMQHFDLSEFVGIVLDESSILKSYMGKTKRAILEASQSIQYRLACTATPSPNDYLELGNHAEFLGVMPSNEMIMRFFINDTMEAGSYMLRPHAATKFWEWCASWSVCLSNPADMGYDGSAYVLPELVQEFVEVSTEGLPPAEGELFRTVIINATSIHKEGRVTAERRAQKVVDAILQMQYNCTRQATQDEHEKRESGIQSAVEGSAPRNRERKRVPTGVLPKEQREVSENAGAKQGNERTAEGENGQQSGISGQDNDAKEGRLIGPSCLQARIVPPEKLQTVAGGLDRDAEESGVGLQDLRLQENGQPPDISSCGSLPQHGESAGVNLHAVQHHLGEGARPAGSFTERREVPNEQWLIWVNSNYEHDEVERKLKSCGLSYVGVKGSDKLEEKESRVQRWIDGEALIMISKPSIFGFGMNFQHCRNMAFVGLSYSYEDYYQAIRRCWRFGQTREVNCYVMAADSEQSILKIIQEKETAHRIMKTEMTKAISVYHQAKPISNNTPYFGKKAGEDWELHHADCVHAARIIEADSIGFSIYSPPFSNLYIYSDSDYDMGNSTNDGEFFEHYSYLAEQLYRITKPGRLTAIHCKDLPMYKGRDGSAGLRDFPGEIIKMYESKGWQYHSRVTIWKDPVIEMQRTKNHGLLYKQLCKDSAASRQGMADYVIVMRKWGDEDQWEPVTRHGERFFDYMGSTQHGPTAKDISRARSPEERERLYSIAVWQRYASPVWFDIDQTDVLNYKLAKEKDEERHICPLQLGVIERSVELWSNPGDLVFSPFTGIGSEGYIALKMGRKFCGVELKKSYFDIACRNLAEARRENGDLFASAAA